MCKEAFTAQNYVFAVEPLSRASSPFSFSTPLTFGPEGGWSGIRLPVLRHPAL